MSQDIHWAEGIPELKTLTFLVVPEESTRMAQLMAGEADNQKITAWNLGQNLYDNNLRNVIRQ